ncbi:peptidyl-prolyl cis-trans isomerase D [Breznakibacter xylanolyticus]|uniref:Periplasmic chaperone PpiD n=1 Tax=Breznakibacter xylanolyticus TaxID=990 RepID=A0A2W7PSI5_9BACT|nr:SurA N-terminal domain-containing protein [Breznakibacter xylanolyticus]PZX12409.1 peptidyl-prolyl cis-trans isomerase D [Breznakibacter xylanolyticus]
MATLEKIRSKSGVIITIIGLALFAFVMTDLFKPGKSLFGPDPNEMAEINGKIITIEAYQAQQSALEEWTKMQYNRTSLDENTQLRLQDQAWEQMVREALLADEYEALGIVVTDDEMLSLMSGKNVHPAIKQMFTNPQTGAFDGQQALESFRRRAENPMASFYWDFLLKEIKNERLYAKYSSLIKNGMAVTSGIVNSEVAAKSQNVSFDFLVKRYSAISDSAITISDREIKDYYKKNLDNFKQEASRDIQYVTFDVVPSEADIAATRDIVVKAKVNFANLSTDAAQYINRNSDNAPYVARNLSMSAIAAQLQSFVSTAAVGDVYGPYEENDAFKLTRLVAIKQMPDSVKARHILISAQTPNADKKADSLLTLVNSGSDFAELARNNSEDQGSAVNGGDLGWFKEGAMVKPFNDACFGGKKGDIVKVQSQFGWHIINVQDLGVMTTKYELATYEKNILPSERTNQEVYSAAVKFASENPTKEQFEKAIEAQNLTPRFGRGIKAMDRRIGALESPRSLVKWAFSANVGEVSPIEEFGNQYVVATLIDIKEEGHASVSSVQNQIKSILAKDKKAEKLIADLKSASQGAASLGAVAGKVGESVQNAISINFGSFQVPGAGVEPALVALATNSAKGAVSGPVKGENGVYMVQVNTIDANPNVNAESEKTQLSQSTAYRVDYQAFQALKSKAEIKDNRSKFY